ncbi:MAG TPA: lysophospholipid acyltransferase family protein [Thermoanaerobaculia bacterium]|nr:lysophospholipid acyltransferase family protein [Thermoanaerobaculia bacterium]
MFRTLFAALVAILDTLVVASLVMVVTLAHPGSRWVDPLIRRWARIIVRAAGIRLSVENLDLIDPARRFVIIANHYSWLDIPCLLAAIPQPIRFMAKVSLFKIPIFGWALATSGFIPVDRKKRSTAVKSFDLAAERIRKGNTIVIFPEEGRSRMRTMRPFQRGAFLLALRSGLPILPMAIDGTFDVFPARSLRVTPGPVTIRVAPPVEIEGMSVRDRKNLAAATRTTIGTMLFGTETFAQMEAEEADSR